MKLGFVLALSVCALAAASPALADSHSVSYSDWTIAGDVTTLKFVLPESEARRLTGVDVPLATTKKLGEYLLAHVAVGGDGENCAPIDQGYDIGLVVAADPETILQVTKAGMPAVMFINPAYRWAEYRPDKRKLPRSWQEIDAEVIRQKELRAGDPRLSDEEQVERI